MASSDGWRRLTIRHLWIVAPLVGFLIGAFRPIRDNSFLWHVRAGSVQLDLGEVLTSDPFSYTMANQPWRSQSWLLELGYGVLDRRWGLEFVPWWLVGCGLVLYVLVASWPLRSGASPLAVALGLTGFVWLGLALLVPRPVLASFVLLACLVTVLEHRQLRWTIPPLIWLWAAVHGSFVVGMGLIVLQGARRKDWALLRPLAAGIAASLLTAHGWRIWEVFGEFVRNRDALDYLTEWAPPELLSISTIPFAMLIVGLLWTTALGRLSTADLWVVAPFLIWGLSSRRALFPAAIVLFPFVFAGAQKASPTVKPRSSEAGLALATAMSILIVPMIVGAASFPGLDPERFPVDVPALSSDPTFHDDVIGGFLIYERWPDMRVFVDDRAELYGAEVFRDLNFTRSGRPSWRSTFEHHGIRQAIVRSDDGISEILETEGWTLLWEDPGRFELWVND